MIYTSHSLFWEAMLMRPLAERIDTVPQELVDHIAQYNAATANPATPARIEGCDDFLQDVRAAVAELPAVVKNKLEPRLLGIFAMTGLGSTGITDVIAYPNGDLIGAFVVLDVDAFADRGANAWATWKENEPFAGDSGVALEAVIADSAADNRQSAIQYILLHEFGHVMAAASGLLPNWWDDAAVADAGRYPFLRLCWDANEDGTIEPRSCQDFPLRAHLRFFQDTKISSSEAPGVYEQLEHTAYPTLYAATSVHEDFAESFCTYVHTQLLGKPREVMICADGRQQRYQGFWQSERGAAKAAFFRALFAEATPAYPNRARHVANASACIDIILRAPHCFLGLAPFLRLSIAQVDSRQIADELLLATQFDQDNPYLWMNLSTVFFASEQQALGRAMQAEGLALQRTYLLPAAKQPAKSRLLMLMAHGDLAENTPLDCLLEHSDVDLVLYYATAAHPLPDEIPPHDAVMVAFSETETNRAILQALERVLQDWPRPVINAPRCIPNTERSNASRLLQDIPGLLMPPTIELKRAALEAVADGRTPVAHLFDGCRFPVILRPVGSHAGRALEKIDDAAAVAAYLSGVEGTDFYISNFIDYRSQDGQFRKYRVAIVAGQPFASHMAISSHWMIHYVNAGMYEDGAKRAEEASFMENFAQFASRHQLALAEIGRRSGLDYVCIDCAEAATGELLIFEIDHAMVVHAMDCEELFPHKRTHMLKVQQAVEQMIHEAASIPA